MPTLEQIRHVIQTMPATTEIERRDRALKLSLRETRPELIGRHCSISFTDERAPGCVIRSVTF